jgi:hypothetical protein
MLMVELKKHIEDISEQYDSQIRELKDKIKGLEDLKAYSIAELQGEYDSRCSEIIEHYENGDNIELEQGVSVRKLKSVIINEDEVKDKKYFKTVVDDKKIKEDLKESGYTITIPGVEVKTKYSIVVKNSQ